LIRPPPQAGNRWYAEQAALLLDSFRHWTGRELLERSSEPIETARRLYLAPFVVVSHGPERDPCFDYGNAAALKLFALKWEDFIQLRSRRSAEPENREERAMLLERVHRCGYIDDYSGVRISARGRRFRIERALVWNLIDDSGRHLGQAASFSEWKFLGP
jgi:hypothetical protein